MKSFDKISKKNQLKEQHSQTDQIGEIKFIKQKKIPINLEIKQIKQKQSGIPKVHVLKNNSQFHIIAPKNTKPLIIHVSSNSKPAQLKRQKQPQDKSQILKIQKSQPLEYERKKEIGDKKYQKQNSQLKDSHSKNHQQEQSQLNSSLIHDQSKKLIKQAEQDKGGNQKIGIFDNLFAFFKKQKNQEKQSLKLPQLNSKIDSKQEKQSVIQSRNRRKDQKHNRANRQSQSQNNEDNIQEERQSIDNEELLERNRQKYGQQSKVSKFSVNKDSQYYGTGLRQSRNQQKLRSSYRQDQKTYFQMQDPDNKILQVSSIRPEIIQVI